MKAVLPFILASLVAVSAAYAVDPGIDLSASGSVTTGKDVTITGSFAPSLHFDLPMGRNVHLVFKGAAGISYPFVMDFSSWESWVPYLTDISELRVVSRTPKAEPGLSAVTFGLGRFTYADPTGYSFAHRLDGFQFTFSYPIGTLDVVTGYTGFLWRYNSGVEMSLTDNLAPDSQYFAAPRLISTVMYRTPTVLGASLYVSALAQEDLRDGIAFVKEWSTEFDPVKGGAMDTQYLSVGLNGTFMNSLVLNAFYTLNTGRELCYVTDEDSEAGEGEYSYQNINAFLFGLTTTVAIPSALGMNLSGRFLYGSGDTDALSISEGNVEGDDTAFKSITAAGTGLVFSPQLGNLMLAGISASMRPFAESGSAMMRSLSAGLSALAFLRATAGQVSEPGVVVGSDSPYLGSEVDLTLGLDLFSDLKASLSTGVFLPGVEPYGAFAASASAIQTSTSLSITLSI